MSQSPEEMQELLGYLKNIRSYERDHIKSERTIIAMMWGLFITLGGLIDGYISILLKYSPHGIVWFAMIAAAMLTQQIISTQPLLYEENFTNEVQRENIPLWEIVMITIIMFLTIPVSGINVAFVMPYIGFAFGTVNLISMIKNKATNRRNLLIVGSFYSSAILGLMIYLIDPTNIKYGGFLFGMMVGVSIFFVGFLSRKELISA